MYNKNSVNNKPNKNKITLITTNHFDNYEKYYVRVLLTKYFILFYFF